MTLRLEDKVALVAGGTRGAGRGIAVRSRRKTQMPGHENLHPPNLPFGRSLSTRFLCTNV